MVSALPARAGSLKRPGPPSRIHSTRAQNISLSDEIPTEPQEDWEPPSADPEVSLSQIKESIGKWEEDLKSKGKEVSGRTM